MRAQATTSAHSTRAFANGAFGWSLQHGFNLLEVLIAIVVLAIGLLGLAGLQNFSLKATHQSYQRTQATVMIHEIIERMRANPSALATYAVPTPTDTVTGPDCAVASCTPPALALHDLRELTTAMTSTSGLGPSGRLQIEQAASFGGGTLAKVTLTWVESYGKDDTGTGDNRVQMAQSMTAHLCAEPAGVSSCR
jgi:type IV pilus assembly protein PilV